MNKQVSIGDGLHFQLRGRNEREELRAAPAQSFVTVDSAKITAAIFWPLKMTFLTIRNDIFWKKR
jgi:hypothetical protein